MISYAFKVKYFIIHIPSILTLKKKYKEIPKHYLRIILLIIKLASLIVKYWIQYKEKSNYINGSRYYPKTFSEREDTNIKSDVFKAIKLSLNCK